MPAHPLYPQKQPRQSGSLSKPALGSRQVGEWPLMLPRLADLYGEAEGNTQAGKPSLQGQEPLTQLAGSHWGRVTLGRGHLWGSGMNTSLDFRTRVWGHQKVL